METNYARNVIPVFSEDLNGWHLTDHARERMGDRGITVSQVREVLRFPSQTMPSSKDDDARIYAGSGLILVVDETKRSVITVGIAGATGRDWEEHAAPQSDGPWEPETPPETQPPRPTRKSRSDRHTAPVEAIRVEPALWRECLRRVQGDARRLRILNSGEVLILNRAR